MRLYKSQEFELILHEKETGNKFLGIIIKQELTFGHKHDRWMELKEALNVNISAIVHVVWKFGHA
jgi:hypothetical protein